MALRILGVPSAAGAYGNGVTRAPQAMRTAGLPEGLRRQGLAVTNAGWREPPRTSRGRGHGGTQRALAPPRTDRPLRRRRHRLDRSAPGPVPHFNQGLPLADALEALAVLAAAPDVRAVLVTEVNPDNDPDGHHVRRLVDGVVGVLGRAMGG